MIRYAQFSHIRQEAATSTIGPLLIVATLIALLAAFPLALAAGINLDSSGIFTVDKATKFLPLSALAAFMLSNLRWRLVNSRLRVPLTLAFIFVISYLLRTLADVALGRGGDVAGKELARLASFLIVLFACCTIRFTGRQKKWLIVGVCGIASVTFPYALQHSLNGSAANSGRYVGEVLRAGSELVDANELGAFFAAASVLALALAVINRSWWGKILAIVLFSMFHVGRALTFSTGSLLNAVIATTIFLYLLRTWNRRASRGLALFLLALGGLSLFALLATGYFEVVFYRVALSDEYVAEATLLSRVAQYIGFGDLVMREPSGLLWGFGAERLVDEIGLGFDLHNSFLRPLGVAGFVPFCAFLLLPLSLLHARRFVVASTTPDGVLGAAGIGVYIGWCVQALTVPGDTHLIFWVIMSMYVVLALGNEK